MNPKAIAILQRTLTANSVNVNGKREILYRSTERCRFCSNSCKEKRLMCGEFKWDFSVARLLKTTPSYGGILNER